MSSKRGSSGRTGRSGGGVTIDFTSMSDDDAVHAYGSSISDGWEDGLSSAEVAALYDYKGSSADLNEAIRGEGTLDRSQIATRDGLDTALSKARLPENIVVMRGVGRHAVDKYFRGNETVLDKGFMSTTGSREIAESFAGNNGYIINVYASRGSRGMYIDNSHHYHQGERRPVSGEREFVFARGSRLRIRGIDDANRTIDAVLEQ